MSNRKGAALLVVLFIVMAITILSLGFLSRSDVELACGENMILRTQMDYLAESGLEHARGLILNPQDVSSEYWTGAESLQIVESSNDYYDVSVERHDPNSGPTYRCNYRITSSAYRLKGGEEVGRSSLTAELRLDPAIGFWVNGGTIISSSTTINGDVYCDDNLINKGTIRGDVFASGTITNSVMSGGTITGSRNENVSSDPVDWPGLAVGDFDTTYYVGSDNHTAQTLTLDDYNNVSLPTSPTGNPKGVVWCDNDITLSGNVSINGTLVVNGNMTIRGTGNTIAAVKNFPALIVNGNLTIESSGQLAINGLAQINGDISVNNSASRLTVFGALFVNGNLNVSAGSVNITAAPARASLETWPTAGNPARWTPAGGAFFKSIERE